MEGVGINSWMALEAADITFEVAEGRRGCCCPSASPATSSANKPTVDGDDGTSLRPRPPVPRPALLKKVRGWRKGEKKDQKRKNRLGTNYAPSSRFFSLFGRFKVRFYRTNLKFGKFEVCVFGNKPQKITQFLLVYVGSEFRFWFFKRFRGWKLDLFGIWTISMS